MAMRIIKLSIAVLLAFTLTACCLIYRQDVQQGNVVTCEQVSMLHVGMPKEQVRYLLGTPLLSHILNCNRWDYVYTCQKGNGPMHVTRLFLFFEGERLAAFRTA